jgi:hypothetical protein
MSACFSLASPFSPLQLFWVDNRIEANATLDPTVHFTPDIEFTNRLQKEALNQQWTYQQGWYGVPQRLIPAELENDTVWSAYSRISATFVTNLDMHDFPMDIHNLSVRMESSLLDNTQFVLVVSRLGRWYTCATGVGRV